MRNSCCQSVVPDQILTNLYAELFFTEVTVPVFWIFRSLVKKHHRQVFQFVLSQNGLSPDKVTVFPQHPEMAVQKLTMQTLLPKGSFMQSFTDACYDRRLSL